MTCKNLLAPENGDIEYILEENERDDITILQVCISNFCKKYAISCMAFSNELLIILGWPTIRIQMQSRISSTRRKIFNLFRDRYLGLRETVLYTLRMSSAEKVRFKHVSHDSSFLN